MHQRQKAIGALFFLLFFGFSNLAHAQGSPYDVIGFGLPVQSGNETVEALGGTGVALRGSRLVNDLNPADWTWINRARFGASLHYNYDNATQNGTIDQQQNIQFSGATFAAPVWNAVSGAIALGYVPLTNATDNIDENGSVSTQNYIIRGGTNLVFAGFAARPTPAIGLGARLDLITGDIRHIGEVTFDDSEAGIGQFERDYIFDGVRPTFGIQLIGDSLSDALSGITIGATYSFAAKLNSTKETINTPLSTLDTTIDESGVGRYPAALSAGISFRLGRRYRAEADYFAQDFSTAYVYSPQAISGDPLLGTSNRIAFGVERVPNLGGEFGSITGLDRWGLRLGFSFGTLPVLSPGAGTVREYAISGGIGIPISLETLLNLSIVAGQRTPQVVGSAPNETFLRLGADVNFSEQWFVQTRRQ